jgi:hypothetical protein
MWPEDSVKYIMWDAAVESVKDEGWRQAKKGELQGIRADSSSTTTATSSN